MFVVQSGSSCVRQVKRIAALLTFTHGREFSRSLCITLGDIYAFGLYFLDHSLCGGLARKMFKLCLRNIRKYPHDDDLPVQNTYVSYYFDRDPENFSVFKKFACGRLSLLTIAQKNDIINLLSSARFPSRDGGWEKAENAEYQHNSLQRKDT